MSKIMLLTALENLFNMIITEIKPVERKNYKPGTAIAKVLKKVGFKPCGGCAKRAEKIDRAWEKMVGK